VVSVQVEFSPTKLQLATMIGSIAGHVTSAIAGIQRLPDLLTRSKSNKDVTYYISSSVFYNFVELGKSVFSGLV